LSHTRDIQNPFQYRVLLILSEGETYGAGLRLRLSNDLNREVATTSIYRVLGILYAKGLISKASVGRRQYYGLNERGRTALNTYKKVGVSPVPD
jgi:DNA-binding PadR family transcriptional regulator